MQLSALFLALLPLAVATHGRQPRGHHARAASRREDHVLDARMAPTTTTTVVVEMTQTQTVWVAPTVSNGSASGANSSSNRASGSASASTSSASRASSASQTPTSASSVSGSAAKSSTSAPASSPSSRASGSSSGSASSRASSSVSPHSSSAASASSSTGSARSSSASLRASQSSSASSLSSSSSHAASLSSRVASSSASRAVSASASASLFNIQAVSSSAVSSSSTKSHLASLSASVVSSPSSVASSVRASSSIASSAARSSALSSASSSHASSLPASSSSHAATSASSATPRPASASSSAAPSSSVTSASARSSASSSRSSIAPSSSAPVSSAAKSSSSTSAKSSSAPASMTSSSASAKSSAVSSLRSSSSSASSSAKASSSSAVASSSSSKAASSSTSARASSTSSSASKTATSTTSSASATSTLAALGSTLMNGYYPDWSGWYLAPESVDFTKFDVIDFAFALPTADFGLEFTQDDSSDLLTRLVALAHAAGKRVKLSIGGWTGSTYFSTICASAANRKTFVANILAAYDSYGIDGIEIDWEYPGVQGAASNAVSSADSANFLVFLQELRAALPSDALISLATQVWPFADASGSPMTDVSGFAAVIDWILVMNYDIWGSSSTPGANAPLSDGCGNSSQPLANAYAAVASWTAAGMPADKITLGVPAYGYLQMSSATQLMDRRRALPVPPHKRAAAQERSYVTVYNDNGGSSDGQVMFEELISQGALVLDAAGEYVGGGGFTREWDSCSSTPWLKSTKSGQVVTYDDPQSMSLKGQFAAQAGLRGCNVFSIDGDWTGSAWPLTDAVRSGLGL